MTDANESFTEKLRRYADPKAAKQWFDQNYERVQTLFADGWVRDFIFEPIKGVFEVRGATVADEIRAAITRVAVVNAVLAGLPGKMGVGVFVSMAFEAWMALAIARRIGIKIEEPTDIFKYFGLLAGVGVTIIWAFKELLSVLFSLFSVVPGLNPLIPAELVATNFIGVLFWIGFEQAKKKGEFVVPVRATARAMSETRSLYSYQWNVLKTSLSPTNLRTMYERFLTWFRGEIPQDSRQVRGEILPTVAMAYLLNEKYEALEGPLGTEFVGAIRDRFPELADASMADIADHMRSYDPEQLAGVINLVKGKLFERMVEAHENGDGDDWTAYLHEDESYPGSDIVFMNHGSGEQIEVSLKATENPEYIESAMVQYPEIPVMGPEEMNALFDDHPGYLPGEVAHADVLRVTEENFEQLLSQLGPIDAAEVAGTGVAVGAAIGLWPFVVAYLRGTISKDQLSQACQNVYGEAGKALASRITYALVLGPVFAWYLLARGVVVVTRSQEKTATRRLAYGPRLEGPLPNPA
jgi:hypothetical protein